jgi:phosphoheptose isomerase
MSEPLADETTERVRGLFHESAELKIRMAEEMAPEVVAAARRMRDSLLAGRRILACGNGGSSGDAQHFVGELTNRFELERPPLPAIALGTNPVAFTAAANDYSFEEVFAKEVQALGGPGDVLVAISTSGRSPNIVRAAEAAQERDLHLVVLTGGDGGELSEMARPEDDVVVRVDSHITARIQEVHILALHCMCSVLDQELFGG